jgi:glycyl-tRNA synthetase beta subunit
VVAQQPDALDDVVERLEAVQAFAALPEAAAWPANKRITNILKKIEGVAIDAHGAVQESLLKRPNRACSPPCRPPVRRSTPPSPRATSPAP